METVPDGRPPATSSSRAAVPKASLMLLRSAPTRLIRPSPQTAELKQEESPLNSLRSIIEVMDIPRTGAAASEDGASRCWWCVGDHLYQGYHDLEWGRPVADD